MQTIKYISVPRFVVNLDDKPENRWNQIINAYKTKFDGVMNVMDKLLDGYTYRDNLILGFMVVFQ